MERFLCSATEGLIFRGAYFSEFYGIPTIE